MIRDQEDRILHLKQLILNKDLKSELLERNQKLLNQIKYKDELIDAMRAEVESFQVSLSIDFLNFLDLLVSFSKVDITV